MKRTWQGLIAALQFLTRIPVPFSVPFTNEVLKRSTFFFPLAGFCIGGLVWAAGWGLQHLLPVFPAAALTLTLAVALQGGLHMDGWMDTADGVLSSRSRERMLEIMKDSRSGAMGVIACVLLLLLKWTLLVSLMELGLWNGWVVVPFIWSRVVMVLALASKPQARPDEGLGGYFLGVKAGHVTIAYLLGFALAALAVAASGTANAGSSLGVLTGLGLSSSDAVLMMSVAAPLLCTAGACLPMQYLSRKLGGLTGDTYGAINEWTETVGLLLLLLAATGKG